MSHTLVVLPKHFITEAFKTQQNEDGLRFICKRCKGEWPYAWSELGSRGLAMEEIRHHSELESERSKLRRAMLVLFVCGLLNAAALLTRVIAGPWCPS